MRTCIRCGAEMEENFIISSGYGVVIRRSRSRAAVTPRAAVCPRCGEVSVYVEEPEKLTGRENA